MELLDPTPFVGLTPYTTFMTANPVETAGILQNIDFSQLLLNNFKQFPNEFPSTFHTQSVPGKKFGNHSQWSSDCFSKSLANTLMTRPNKVESHSPQFNRSFQSSGPTTPVQSMENVLGSRGSVRYHTNDALSQYRTRVNVAGGNNPYTQNSSLYSGRGPSSLQSISSIENGRGQLNGHRIPFVDGGMGVRRPDKSVSMPNSWKNVLIPSSRSTLNSTQQSFPMYSRKLFVGGLPAEAPQEYIEKLFQCYGSVIVDWPREPTHPKENRKYPQALPKLTGYVFLVYESEMSVHRLIQDCVQDDGQFFLMINGNYVKQKPAHVRPWFLSSIDYLIEPYLPFNPHRTVFIGGVPRTTTASDLGRIMEKNFGSVAYVGIDIDPELKYPKGAARVVFKEESGYVNAIVGRFVRVPNADGHRKEVEVKPYVLDDIMCDECGNGDNSVPANFFCGDASCLQYYCTDCWLHMHHSNGTRCNHIPLVKIGEQTKLLSDLLPAKSAGEMVQNYLQMTSGQ